MRLFGDIVNTRHLPATASILKTNLPSVLESKCFNEEKLPFAIEVTATEIGHLFEHILLTYLCKKKVGQGARRATFRGVTDWNWKKDPWGTFHITIGAGAKEEDILMSAMTPTISLVTKVLEQQYSEQERPSFSLAQHA